jgi:hypothetical protein
MNMVNIPDVVFLVLDLACLMTLLSIRRELRKITHTKRKRYSEWSLEDQLKLRVKYLHQCRRIENHPDRLKSHNPETVASGLTA